MKLPNDGFTIIELLIATAVFSIILLISTSALIGISQTYVKGSVQDETQQTARSVMTDISQNIQFNNIAGGIQLLGDGNGIYYFCLGDDVYVYTMDNELSSTNDVAPFTTIGLLRYNASGGCPKPITMTTSYVTNTLIGSPSVQQLLAGNERIGELYFTPSTEDGTQSYQITLEIGYGDNDLLDDMYPNVPSADVNTPPSLPSNPPSSPNTTYQYKCQSGSDSSFCAVSILTTTVAPRITNN